MAQASPGWFAGTVQKFDRPGAAAARTTEALARSTAATATSAAALRGSIVGDPATLAA